MSDTGTPYTALLCFFGSGDAVPRPRLRRNEARGLYGRESRMPFSVSCRTADAVWMRVETDRISNLREVVLYPTRQWGGEGLIGCNIGYVHIKY